MCAATAKPASPSRAARTKALRTKSPRTQEVRITPAHITATAKAQMGFESLRPGQQEAIQSLLNGRDTVVVQPTGSGKSAIYQIAGALLTGAVVVVSPLIALQKDQADSIQSSRLREVAVVNSTLTASERRDTLDRIENGSIEYILLAPEQLRKTETMERLHAAGVALFVVDEAHCVSQWGHDFRPDYLELNRVIEALGHPPVLAMTATASNDVREEIIGKLGLNKPQVLVHGFDRPNISLRVDIFNTEDEKREALLKMVEFAQTPGLIYTATHEHAESIAIELQQRGIEALSYHGGLKAQERTAIQDRFMQGDAPLIVATNAFGMGIDKSNIRFVYHADVSDSLDAYYQEIGRAGRDGQPAEAVLFFRSRDISAQAYKTGGKIDMQQLDTVMNALTQQDHPVTPEELASETDLPPRRLTNTIHRLEEVGAVQSLDTGEVKYAKEDAPDDLATALLEQERLHKNLHKRRLQQMQQYAEGHTCRREVLLRYFGDLYTGPCGNCDRCEANGVPRTRSQPAASTGSL